MLTPDEAFQTVPLAVIALPPSEVISPPNSAELLVKFVAVGDEIDGAEALAEVVTETMDGEACRFDDPSSATK